MVFYTSQSCDKQHIEQSQRSSVVDPKYFVFYSDPALTFRLLWALALSYLFKAFLNRTLPSSREVSILITKHIWLNGLMKIRGCKINLVQCWQAEGQIIIFTTILDPALQIEVWTDPVPAKKELILQWTLAERTTRKNAHLNLLSPQNYEVFSSPHHEAHKLETEWVVSGLYFTSGKSYFSPAPPFPPLLRSNSHDPVTYSACGSGFRW